MQRLLPLLPVFFVILWHTGFLGARGTMPHGPALTTLSIRCALVLVLLASGEIEHTSSAPGPSPSLGPTGWL